MSNPILASSSSKESTAAETWSAEGPHDVGRAGLVPEPSRRASTLRSRFNAWGLARIDRRMHRLYGRRKVTLLGDTPRDIVELGPGPGANLRYYLPGTRLVAFEPTVAMHARLRAVAQRRRIELDLRPRGAENLDLDDGSVDLVVATLVLCSVADPAAVVAEVHRVLRPGGRFVFVEHVVAPEGRLRWGQRLARRPWHFFFDGCCLDRDTASLLRRAGFASLQIESFRAPPRFMPMSPHIAGVAVR